MTAYTFGRHTLTDRETMSGIALITWYDNGFGASVIRPKGSREERHILWELAVISRDPTGKYNFTIRYDTPITDDVVRMQTDRDITGILDRIAALPPNDR